MAAWQFDFHLVPRQKMFALFGELPKIVDWDKFNSVDWWENNQLSEDHGKMLDSFLPQSVHWNATTRMWGEENGNRIEISTDGGKIRYILVRFNVSERDDQFLTGIIRFAKYIESVIITAESRHVGEPSVNFLVAEVRESNAYRFVQDPKTFLESISKGEIKFRGFG